MKKSFFKKYRFTLLTIAIVIAFFFPQLIFLKIPIPADSLLGLYHPFRDKSFDGFSPQKFPVHNPLITDPMMQIYPWKNLVVDNFKNLKLPLWNPYSFSGQPLLANLQSSSFSVFNLPLFVLPFKFGWALQIILTLMSLSFFMYLFLKNRGLGNIAALFGALVLAFSGFSTSWMSWGIVIATFTWLPLILFSIEKFFEKDSKLYFLILHFTFLRPVSFFYFSFF